MSHLSAWFYAAAFVLVGHVAQAAALGENIASVSAQAKATVSANNNTMKVSAKTSSLGASYSTREIFDGVRTVTEYVNAEGVVFAVRWKGLGLPDLSEIFGKYYEDFRTEVRSKWGPKNRRSASIQTADLVYSNYSHGSSMSGFAYLVKLLPAGIAPGDLK